MDLISALPDTRWILAVRGEIPKDIETNSRVLLRKDAKWEELPVLYNAANFSVCPSYYEPFGYVVAESLACGTPVIASARWGKPRISQNTSARPLVDIRSFVDRAV